MKTLGLIGGTSWVSTIDYYRFINQGINDKLGGVNAAQLLLHSFNYADIVKNHAENNWDKTTQMIIDAGIGLKNAGAEAIILCANTLHLVAEEAEQGIGLPVINIAIATAKVINQHGLTKVALLGTKFTMEKTFFTDKLTSAGIEAITPNQADRDYIHQTLMDELGKGILLSETKARYLKIMEDLVQNGAQAIILGCTEIPLLIKPEDTNVMQFDTTQIHSAAAVEFALG
ncbi:aspartate/glutamate racemase family protein [Mucilaginibacter sp. RB4R14]|uniref:aspartate/glutamate racemase family protein n=1 Tax=Mucilaginibacter aurantiaciroseus TaxID=2949308 RepID=UPI0020912BFF|nr:aspartate/glutamate racemase family protein [Mucilaginibacter aurantiaciroseus]MCO5935022.1 aspartate/glutamate racemase family protein [Mucilaginibacter aurantiaciroseus]